MENKIKSDITLKFISVIFPIFVTINLGVCAWYLNSVNKDLEEIKKAISVLVTNDEIKSGKIETIAKVDEKQDQSISSNKDKITIHDIKLERHDVILQNHNEKINTLYGRPHK